MLAPDGGHMGVLSKLVMLGSAVGLGVVLVAGGPPSPTKVKAAVGSAVEQAEAIKSVAGLLNGDASGVDLNGLMGESGGEGIDASALIAQLQNPGAGSGSPKPPTAQPTRPTSRLTATVRMGHSFAAVVDGRVRRVGETVSGGTIVEIGQQHLVLESASGERTRLELSR